MQNKEHKVVAQHAPWELEKQTEGLDDAPKKSATSGSKETKGSEEGEKGKKESSGGCGCKYF